ncbi:hypothetical protein HYY75_12705 [bacterium]|nr:hypothetical protein [bacterium]
MEKAKVAGLLFFFILSILGCQEKRIEPSQSPSAPRLMINPPGTPGTIVKVTLEPPKSNEPRSNEEVKNHLSLAQREYLIAYEKYVKALREEGPQNIETLKALANYQEKYQLYQMLLSASDF